MFLKPIQFFEKERRNDGIYRGIVVDNKDPLKRGRIKVKIEGKLESENNDWLPWCYPRNSTGFGGRIDQSSFAIPRIHSEVTIRFPLAGLIYHPEYDGYWRSDKTHQEDLFTPKEDEDAYTEAYGFSDDTFTWLRVNRSPQKEKRFAEVRHTSGSFVRIDYHGNIQFYSSKDISFVAERDIDVKAGRHLKMQIERDLHLEIARDFAVDVLRDIGIESGRDFKIKGANDVTVFCGGSKKEAEYTEEEIEIKVFAGKTLPEGLEPEEETIKVTRYDHSVTQSESEGNFIVLATGNVSTLATKKTIITSLENMTVIAMEDISTATKGKISFVAEDDISTFTKKKYSLISAEDISTVALGGMSDICIGEHSIYAIESQTILSPYLTRVGFIDHNRPAAALPIMPNGFGEFDGPLLVDFPISPEFEEMDERLEKIEEYRKEMEELAKKVERLRDEIVTELKEKAESLKGE